MSSSNARKATHSGKDAPHLLSIPHEGPLPDREPHSYERW